MKKYFTIKENLYSEISELKGNNYDDVIINEKIANKAIEMLGEIRKSVVRYGFKNSADEIYFFKEIKPAVLSQYILATYQLDVIMRRKMMSGDEFSKYEHHKLSQLERVFNDNLSFILYIEKKSVDEDTKYFLRNENIELSSSMINLSMPDKEFTTGYDTLLAYYMAYSSLKGTKEEVVTEHKSSLSWTGSKIALVELVYALKHAGVINGGNVSIKELTDKLGEVLNIRIEQPHRVFTDVITRKTERSSFIDNLQQSLQRTIEGML